MYIYNFSFFAQFGGELREEQTQEMIEIQILDQKTTSLGLKSRDPQKAHLGYDWSKNGKIFCFCPLSTTTPNWGITEF